MKYRKGSTITTWDCCTIIPLFDWSNHEKAIRLIPRFPLQPEFFSSDRFLARYDDASIQSFIRKLWARTDSSDYYVASILAALYVLTDDSTSPATDMNGSNNADFYGELDHFPTSLCNQSWMLVKDKIALDDWKHLLATLLRNIHIVTRDHPLVAYSRDLIPYMSKSELEDLVTILKLDTKCRSAVGLQSIIQQQFCSSETTPTFVIVPSMVDMAHVHNTRTMNAIKHSCLPTAQLVIEDDNKISLKALFDISSDDDVSISYVTDDTVEERDKRLQYRIGQSCSCVRCLFEMIDERPDYSGKSHVDMNLSHSDLIRIGRHLLMKEEFHKAKFVYREAIDKALSVSGQDDVVPDIYHALGAIELSMGNFLTAQRVWNDANRDHPQLCSDHDGIALQIEKIRSYGYFDEESYTHKSIRENTLNWDSPAPNCFVASVLGGEACQKVIDWAETFGKWTTKRHYAVPTFDVPIHTVPPLLDWFRNEFMNPIIHPLLAMQFKTNMAEGQFYVHDAFCVRYESNAVANHLPIHVDESTHSLVVALNDDFEGGGTYFPDADIVLCPPKGSVISFRGDTLRHGGQAVTKGVRYILAVFLYYDTHHHKLSGMLPILTKCSPPDLTMLLRKRKQQKTDFSFNFDC